MGAEIRMMRIGNENEAQPEVSKVGPDIKGEDGP